MCVFFFFHFNDDTPASFFCSETYLLSFSFPHRRLTEDYSCRIIHPAQQLVSCTEKPASSSVIVASCP